MSKNNNLLLRYDKYSQYILIGLTVIAGFLAFLFWQNPLTVYDAAGHVSLVRTIASDFWPRMSGWNANEILGWPQGIFYPSFFHWLAAGLSFLVGVQTAVKLLIFVAIIILPLSIYTFARSVVEEKIWAAVATIGLFLLLLLFPNFLGTGFRSLFQVGLLSNFFVLPILFFFLASVHKGSNYLLSGLLLALIIVTHIVVAIVAAIYLVLLIKVKFLSKELTRSVLVNYVKLLSLAAILTAFFWIPFLLNIEHTSVSRHVSSYFLPNVVVFAVSMLVGFYAWRKREENIFILSMFAAFIAFMATIDAFLIRGNGTSFFLYQFHIYRFQPFAYLLLAAAGVILASKHIKFDRWNLTLPGIIFAGFGFIVLVFLVKNPASIPNYELKLTDPLGVKGRFLETFRRTESDPYWYGVQTEIVEKNSKAAWTYGLFTDSSPNGPYLGSLIRSIRPEVYPEGEGVFIETKFVSKNRVPQLLNHLGVDYLINLQDEEENVVGTFTSADETRFFNAEKISKTECKHQGCQPNFFEVVTLPLKPVENDWDNSVEEWWVAAGEITTLPYFTEGKKISEISEKDLQNARIKILEANEGQTRFNLKVRSENPVPILTKISYFPYWKAFQDGKKIPIYRAAPNLMFFEAEGEVELVYQEPVWINWLYVVSSTAWLIAILAVIQMTNVKFRMSNEAQNPKSKKV